MWDWLTSWRRRGIGGDGPEPSSRSRPRTPADALQFIRQHLSLRADMGGNHTAPLADPRMILDVRTGMGRWAMEVAQEFPRATVIGLNSTLPDPIKALGAGLDDIPLNVRFVEADLAQPLPFPDETFDFVNIRLLYQVLPAEGWLPLLREAWRVVKPGGWVESLEALPFPKNEREGMATIIGWMADVMRLDGKDPLIAIKLPQMFHDIGLMDVTTRDVWERMIVPEEQEQRRLRGLQFIERNRAPILAYQLTSTEEYDRMAAKARVELQGDVQARGFKTTIVYGRR